MNGLYLWQNKKQFLLAHGTYYGLTWSQNYIYVSFNPQHRNVTEIEVFNKNLVRIGNLETGDDLHGVHQIFFWDGELHVVNTSVESVYVYNQRRDVCHFNWTGYETDNHHLNSIWIDNNYIYAVEGLTKNPGDFFPTVQMLTHQYKPAKKFIFPASIQLHNVYVEDGTMYSLAKFGLVQKKLSEKRYQIIDLRPDEANGFLRGLARGEKYFYVGESQIKPRELRPYGDSRVLVLNEDYKIIHIINLKNTGQIHDIRIVNGVDLAHNGIGLGCNIPKDVVKIQ